MLLRPLAHNDAPALLTFYNNLSPATIRVFRPLGSRTSLEICQLIVAENELSPAPRFDLVACDHTAIVGWAFLAGLDTDHPDLGIAVADGVQGQRLGTALLASIVAWAREHGLPAIYLMVVQDNHRAINLYQRNGFVAYDEEFDAVDKLPYYHMVTRLQEARADG